MATPFTYLGLPVVGNPRRLSFWEPVIAKFRLRLSKWRRKCLSFAGRLCLVKSVLSTLPLYFVSMFRMLIGVVRKCSSLVRNFLWGGVEGENKIAWVSWERVCRPKEEGGLGVRDLSKFNRALLGKWRWRLLMERESLWYRVLVAKYGSAVPSWASNWWKDLHLLCSGSCEGGWFDKGVRRVVGEGNEVSFWQDNWLGEGPLNITFSSLFTISAQQNNTIKEMEEWRGGRWTWQLEWRSPLGTVEESCMENLIRRLSCFVPIQGRLDSWRWIDDRLGSYTVKSAYFSIIGTMHATGTNAFKLLWSVKAPSNVLALAWKVLINRVQTKVNLSRRGWEFDADAIKCSLCAAAEENTSHLFFACPVVRRVWALVSN